MQTYLLATNLFALTALLLGLYDFSKGRYGRRLVPLFLLVINRLLSLIVYLQNSSTAPLEMVPPLLAALEVLGVFIFVWVLINFDTLPLLWQKFAWLAGGLAFFLWLTPIFPDWPVPYQLHSLIIAIFGGPFIFISLRRLSWIHIAAPLALALANFLDLVDLSTISSLVGLLAYIFLIGALHWESLQAYRGRQAESEVLAQNAIHLSQERQRTLEVSEIISSVPGLSQSMEHVARSMAHITHTDQSIIFMLGQDSPNQIRPAAIYAPEQSVSTADFNWPAIELDECPPLQRILTTQQQQLLHPLNNDDDLYSLYTLWDEYRIGPTLIQPLYIQGKPIGALVLGNPVTKQLIKENDQRLCENLASQIALMVEAYRYYFDFQNQDNSSAADPLETLAQTETFSELVPSPVADAVPAESTQTLSPARPVAVASELLQPESTIDMFPLADSLKAIDSYLTIIETLQEGVIVSDVSGRVQLVNRAAERILMKPRWELLEQPIGTIYGKIDSGEAIESLATAFSRRDEPLPTYFEDEERAIQGQLIPWRNDQREWMGIIAVFRDVTRFVKADKARNDFIGALSRTLRHPLTIVKGYSEMITNGSMGDYSEEQLHVQRIIHSSAEQVVQILDNAVQISAQNKRQNVPKFKKVNVVEVINQAVNDVTPLAELRGLDLVWEIKSDLPPIIADEKYVHRILENLLNNACRFTPSGGRVTLQAGIQGQQEGGGVRSYLQLAVIDNGVGIPPIEHKRIFDPFYQLDNQNPDEEAGMGMGLAVVKDLVDLHNGRIFLESTPGVGSVFQVLLPVNQS